jgi:tocopherol O-methyltransferase
MMGCASQDQLRERAVFQIMAHTRQITADQIKEHYDSLALVYRAFWGDHIHHGLFQDSESPAEAQVKMLSHCVEILGLHGGEEVLDVGCGHGGTLIYLAQEFGCSGIGVTISPAQARIANAHAARAHLGETLSFVIGDADRFSFPAGAFDVVWVMESSEHFLDKQVFFRNVASTLGPGGKLLLAAWTGSMDNPRVGEVARAFLCPELWTRKQYELAIESAGVNVVYTEDLSANVIRTWEVCRERVAMAKPVLKLMPRAVQEFAAGMELILEAYRTGDLTYTVMSAVAS